MKMKINNCKLCEPVENQKLSGEKGCRHVANNNAANAAATAAFLSSQHYIRDFLAFHLLTSKGKYQLNNYFTHFKTCKKFHFMMKMKNSEIVTSHFLLL